MNITLPNPEIYQSMGQKNITLMVREVYKRLAESPIAAMFPQNMDELLASADKSALFWVTACGGPPLYEQAYGPPRMRARHMSFPIDHEARNHWLACWIPVLETAPENFAFPREHLQSFKDYLEGFSLWMENR